MIKTLLHLQHILLLAFFILASSQLKAQTTWHTSHITSQYKIEYSDPVNCHFSEAINQSEYIFLKITNLTSQSFQISFRIDTYYIGSGCATCGNNEYVVHFTVPANNSISTDCSFATSDNRRLAIFKKFINKTNLREFEKFEITQIQVE